MPTTWCNWPPDIAIKRPALRAAIDESVTVHQKLERDMNYLRPHNVIRLACVTLMTKTVRPKYFFCYWITNKANVLFFVTLFKREREVNLPSNLFWGIVMVLLHMRTHVVGVWIKHTHTHRVVLPRPLFFPFQSVTRPAVVFVPLHKNCSIRI